MNEDRTRFIPIPDEYTDKGGDPESTGERPWWPPIFTKGETVIIKDVSFRVVNVQTVPPRLILKPLGLVADDGTPRAEMEASDGE